MELILILCLVTSTRRIRTVPFGADCVTGTGDLASFWGNKLGSQFERNQQVGSSGSQARVIMDGLQNLYVECHWIG
ncbi:hypothetical protein BX661DRAFT_189167, partial [Kickxella alabastrina]|uniref:uncharacterized protein n=1 Tax=Kickxella alabastrina TaxID=61397 RepID=UPI00221E398D